MFKKLFTATLILLFSALSFAQPPKVPKSYTFAGQTVKFNRSDLRERMDRELIAFTYTHSISVLMLKRAPKLFPVVEPILKRYGIPDDLKYLMVIESNCDVCAKSPAGASGLWQFMQASGREYGLEVNSNVDERYNVEKSTEAACKYLLWLYAKFGDWMSVCASYNAGPTAISSRLEFQDQASALDLLLFEETSRYMFRAMAAKMMFENPSSFGFDLEMEDLYKYNPPAQTVTVTDPIENLVTFAKKYGVSYMQLRMENQWLRENHLNNSSHKTYNIAIPSVK